MSDDLERRLKELLEERGAVGPATQRDVVDSIGRLPDRRGRSRSAGPVAIAAAVAVLAIIGLTSVVLPRSSGILGPSASVSAPLSTPSPTTSPTPTLQPRPVWAKDLASHVDCDGALASIGMDVPDIPSPVDPANTPEAALEGFLTDYPSIPRSLLGDGLVVGHWALHRHVVEDRPKVHIVSTNQFPRVPEETRWQVVGMRACDPAEY